MSVLSNLTGKYMEKFKYFILPFGSRENDLVGKTKPKEAIFELSNNISRFLSQLKENEAEGLTITSTMPVHFIPVSE